MPVPRQRFPGETLVVVRAFLFWLRVGLPERRIGMNQLYILHTTDGTQYSVYSLQKGTRWFVKVSATCTHECKSLAKALFTLGGVVNWNAWDEDSRAMLQHLNNGKAI